MTASIRGERARQRPGRSWERWLGLLCLAGLALLLPGCGSKFRPPVPVHPAEGKVLVGGQPAGGAQVVLWPRPEKTPLICPNAIVEPDGSFRLTSFAKGDGAPEGEYAVTVVWAPTTRVNGETIEEPDKLNGRYSDPNSSGLKAVVQKGKNALAPFELAN